jgi:lipid A 3-O-deacylase
MIPACCRVKAFSGASVLAVLFGLFGTPGYVFAGPVPCQQRGARALNLLVENDTKTFPFDLFHQSDDEYTNGVQATWARARATETDGRNQAVWPFGSDPDRCYSSSVGLGQSLYTPVDLFTTERITTDRPYAAWLYGTYAVHAYRTEENAIGELTVRTKVTVDINAGIIGPAAQGEWAQNTAHRVFNIRVGDNGPIKIAMGWANQLPNEPALYVEYRRDDERTEGFIRRSRIFDVSTKWRGTFGNVFIFGGAGGRVRFGFGLHDEGVERPTTLTLVRAMSEGSTSAAGQNASLGTSAIGWLRVLVPTELYWFGESEGRLVFRNEFLDGPLFRAFPTTIQKRPVVGDAEAGLVIAWGPVKATYRTVVRTAEFFGQPANHYFGSFALTFGAGL